MRDAAAAAEMSDPVRNRWFSRLWTDPSDTVVADPDAVPSPAEDVENVELVGIDLLLAWRRDRAAIQVGRP